MTVDSRKKVQPEEKKAEARVIEKEGEEEDVTTPPPDTSFVNLSCIGEKMRLQVQIGTECVVVPCKPDDTIHSVAKRSVEKLRRLRPKLPLSDDYFEVRRTIGNSLLDPEDQVSDVLKDSDFIIVAATIEETEDAKEAKKQEEIDNARAEIERIDTRRRKVSFVFDSLAPMVLSPPTRLLVLDGNSLLPQDLVSCEKGECAIQLSMEAEDRIKKGRLFLEKIANEHRAVYGVTTGFGTFSNVLIPPEKVKQLQLNLIRSHATGYGEPLAPNRARMLLALRINILAKGHSGISLSNIKKMIAAFNAFCVSYVPQQGTVGCSGDLCPLAHLALGLLGEGKMWSPTTGWQPADLVLKKNNLEPLELGPKEGLALINGTQMVTALGAYTVERAQNIARQADVIAALSLDVLKGTTRAYDPDIHRIRPHRGQNLSALRLRALLHSEANPSQIAESHRNCKKVQDAYTLRCVPQVHGVVHDTIQFVREIITTEMNSATDNPLVFADREEIISGGNFHGEYPAKALDYLAIAVAELAQMSERRLERLVNKELSGLPTFLTPDGGLNSGFMTVQLCAASLVSENKVLCHPSSVDSIPTSCNQEDHVSMGGFSARKALTVVEHVEAVLAMELLAACQGIEFLKPLMSTAPLHKVYQMVRSVAPPLNEDRYMKPEIDAVVEMIRDNRVWETVLPHLETLEAMEELDPDALRQFAKTPTGIVQDRSIIAISDDEESDE
uniref:Histidine ammonia-lyase n=1 Tax=Caenorhabditis japonica TaxID=281687 RepID=A0A8R1HZV4_CAEJA